jgi:hypothetical protein
MGLHGIFMRMKTPPFYPKFNRGIAKCFAIGLLSISAAFADIDSAANLQENEPPTGNGPFYTGLGLTLGGITFQFLGLWAIAANSEDEVEYGPRDIYGDPYDSTVISNTIPVVFGIGCILAGTGMEIFAIPRFVKGTRLREKRLEWLKRTEVSVGYDHRNDTYLFKSTYYF